LLKEFDFATVKKTERQRETLLGFCYNSFPLQRYC